MVIINGFWTGAVVGVLFTLTTICVIAIHCYKKQIETKKEVAQFIQNLDNAAKIKVTEFTNEGDSDNESND